MGVAGTVGSGAGSCACVSIVGREGGLPCGAGGCVGLVLNRRLVRLPGLIPVGLGLRLLSLLVGEASPLR